MDMVACSAESCHCARQVRRTCVNQTQGGGGAPCQKAVYGQYIGYLEQSDSHTHMQDSRSYIAREREREKGPQHTVASGAPSGAVSSRRLHARACIYTRSSRYGGHSIQGHGIEGKGTIRP